MFTGSIVAIVTPMLESGDIDYSSFSKLIDWHLDNGTNGIVVLGTTGESPTVDDNERAKLVKHAVSQVKGRVPIIVGTGGNSTRHAIELTKQAMSSGADAALLVTPYYNKPTQEGLYQHFKAVADAAPLPQILYNVPSRTGCDLLPDTIKRLAKVTNIVGVKEATGNLERAQELLDANLEIDLLSGDDNTAMEFILAGGKGVISVIANILPKTCSDLCAAALAGDRSHAEEINNLLQPMYKMLFAESNPIPVKWALAQMGRIPSGIRLPLTPLAKQYHQDVRTAMQGVGIF